MVVVALGERRARVEQLARLLDGELAPEDARRDVARLATLASSVRSELPLPTLEDDVRDRIRTRVLAELHTDAQASSAPARTTTARRRLAVATGVASVLVGTSGVAVASQQALPGDALYGIKQATESVRVAAAGDLTEQGRVELALAAERLDELTAAVARGDVRDEVLIDTLARMDTRSRDGAEALVRVAERTGEVALLDEVARFTERQARGIVDVRAELPVTVRPHADASLEVLRAIRDDLLDPLLGTSRFAAAEGTGALEQLLRSSPLPAPGSDAERAGGSSADAPSTTGTARDGGSTSTPTGDPALPLPEAPATGGGTGDGRTIVPRLPGPLDGAGGAVDDTVGGVIEGTGDLVEDAGSTVGDVVDGVGGVVEDTVDGVGGVVDDTVGGVGGLVDGVGGLLGR